MPNTHGNEHDIATKIGNVMKAVSARVEIVDYSLSRSGSVLHVRVTDLSDSKAIDSLVEVGLEVAELSLEVSIEEVPVA